MHPDLPRIRDLQDIDNRIRELDEEVARLPKYVAQIENQLEAHKKALQGDKDALEENRKSRTKMEGEIGDFQQKASRFRGQMSEARTNEQFRAFQHEIGFFEREISKVEDHILDKMVESETLDENVTAAQKALDEEATKVAAEVAKVKARVAEDRQETASQRARRDELKAHISDAVMSSYERIRKSRGFSVARADAEYCLACNVMMRPQFSQTLRNKDEILTCESCGRILYYEPPGRADSGESVDESAVVNS